jgi:hypothetical protein
VNGSATVKLAGGELLLPLVTTMVELIDAAVGTCTVMLLALQVLGTTVIGMLWFTLLTVWFNVTVPELPKPVPVIFTPIPVGPDVSERLVILGATAKNTPALATPASAVTVTGPLLASVGTVVTMLESLTDVTVPANPLKATWMKVPFVAPKLDPVIVTVVPSAPELGDRVAI